jgi:uncharacterized membrane protein
MDAFFLLKTVHIVGAAVLLGTGMGIAFFMLMAHRTREPAIIAHTAGIVVIADIVFTASAVILQPLTGVLLISIAGYDFNAAWISVALALYVLTGICWLPVVWIQYRIRNLARAAVRSGSSLPAEYFRLFQIWFVLGIPAFAAVLGIFWLMVRKPATIF